jgi:DNA-binding XRE family transcriptional regulator
MFGTARDIFLGATSRNPAHNPADAPCVADSLSEFLRWSRSNIPADASRLGDYERLPSRVGKPVTQEEIAEAVGVTRTWYGKLETGDSARPSLTLLRRMAAALMLQPPERAQLFSLAIGGL